MLAGCAAPGLRRLDFAEDLLRRVELSDTPFNPQEEFQCGPAALATVLQAQGFQVTPRELAPRVYLPGRQGSLQVEMLAAARRSGALVVVLEPRIESLLRELAGGNAVVVLLNLGLGWAPSWHYAVAVGYDLDARVMVLRSGPMRRQEMSLDTFEHTWSRSERWAFVAVAPGRLPASAGEAAVTQGLIAFARVAPPAATQRAYDSAARRWPGSLGLLTGLGNAAVAAGDLRAALAAFEAAVRAHPQVGAAHNNLAGTLMELGRLDEARQSARRAIELGGEWTGTARQTLAEIEQRAAAAAKKRPERRR